MLVRAFRFFLDPSFLVCILFAFLLRVPSVFVFGLPFFSKDMFSGSSWFPSRRALVFGF